MNRVHFASRPLLALAFPVLLSSPLAFGSAGHEVSEAVGGDSISTVVMPNPPLTFSESLGATGLLGLAMDPTFVSAQSAAAAPAGQQSSDAAELAKKLANPVASLISLPFQFNYDDGYGPKGGERLTLNIQPVIPFSLNDDWNLITRTIVPVIYQASVADGVDGDFGLGDTTQSFFFSPKDAIGGWTIGAGPVVLWPTGTEPRLRNETVGLGPTLVALRQEEGWTVGALANHLWSVTSSIDHEQVNATLLQPFLAYTWPTATTITLNTESTYDWNVSEWSVPLNLMLTQVVKLGGRPVSLQFGGRYYVETPEDGPDWGLRFTKTFLFPR